MKIVLFDWTAGGHHACYLRQFASALSGSCEIVVAAPGAIQEELSSLSVERYELPSSRPRVDPLRALGPQHSGRALTEIQLLRAVIADTKPDHVIHMYGDPVLRWLVRQPLFETRLTLCVFFARAHYPSVYGSPLPGRERMRAWFQKALLSLWRRRSDAHGLFMLDQEAARLFSNSAGPKAFWLPEPPVAELARDLQPRERQGAVVYGSLAARKGIDLLAAAVASPGPSLKVTLAGAVEPEFEKPLQDHVRRIRQCGSLVNLRPNHHDENQGLAVLAGARCAVLPYPRHYGMSRVLLEACSVGTPVVVNNYGLIGHLVRKWELGKTVDCHHPTRFRQALEHFCDDPDAGRSFSQNLANFVQLYSRDAFRRALTAAFAENTSRVPQRNSVLGKAAALDQMRGSNS